MQKVKVSQNGGMSNYISRGRKRKEETKREMKNIWGCQQMPLYESFISVIELYTKKSSVVLQYPDTISPHLFAFEKSTQTITTWRISVKVIFLTQYITSCFTFLLHFLLFVLKCMFLVKHLFKKIHKLKLKISDFMQNANTNF